MPRTIIKVYERCRQPDGSWLDVKIAGAFSKERALEHARRIAGRHARFVRRGDQLGYAGGYPSWVYIKLSELPGEVCSECGFASKILGTAKTPHAPSCSRAWSVIVEDGYVKVKRNGETICAAVHQIPLRDIAFVKPEHQTSNTIRQRAMLTLQEAGYR